MTDTSFDIIIIGAGAAGLMAAIAAPGACILEKMPRPARKMMITGKGRCNFSNVKPWQDFSSHVHPKANVIKSAFYSFPPEKVMEMFENAGLECVVERGERAFPVSHKAVDVVDTLVRLVRENGSTILCGTTVTAVTKQDDGFLIDTAGGRKFHCSRLVITCGGLSYPATGSSGDGYRFAQALGHSTTRLYPSLTALVPVGYKTGSNPVGDNGLKHHIHRDTPLASLGKKICGRSMKNVNVTLYIDGQAVMEEFGDIDFTDGGIEGPIGFKVSRKAVVAMENGSRVSLEISYKNPREGEKPLRFDIAGFVGYERCVVTAGGVSCEEISGKTMESRIIPGLYFAGEVLDIDCDTGGYNLQTAFSTGFLAGSSAARR